MTQQPAMYLDCLGQMSASNLTTFDVQPFNPVGAYQLPLLDEPPSSRTCSPSSSFAQKNAVKVSIPAADGVGKTFWAERFIEVIALPVTERAAELSKLFDHFKLVANAIATVIFQVLALHSIACRLID